MANPHTIYVTSLFNMPEHVVELAPARLISIIQHELQPRRPASLAEFAHLRLGVHDIVEEHPAGVLIQASHVADMIDFLHAWEPSEGALMTHCYAGVSRSTASALVAHYMKTGDAQGSAQALWSAAPHAIPNRRVIELADELLGCAGELLAAREALNWGRLPVHEAPLTTLTLG